MVIKAKDQSVKSTAKNAINRVARLNVKVTPNSAKSEVVAWFDGRLKVKVSAQPERGKANREVIRLLSESLSLRAQDIELVSGETHSHKVFVFTSLNQEQLHQRIDALLLRNTKPD